MVNKPVVFFDGVCGLCNSLVNFLIQRDRQRKLLFSPLQGETAKALLSEAERDKLDTLVLYDDGVKYYKSTAVLRMLLIIGGGWQVLSILKIFPQKFRDWVYTGVANRRYTWFSKKETCRIPTEEERGVILD